MSRRNERGCLEHYFAKQHLTLEQLKSTGIPNNYLYKPVRLYPKNVEFHVSHLRHDTNLQGYHGIWKSEGFTKLTRSDSPTRDLVWWSLDISKDDISMAEQQYLDKQKVNYREKPFLHRFTTSPAFQSSSRLGNFRFSMPVCDVLETYRQQFCRGQKPNIRIFETVVYKQEVMYSVVVHSPHVQYLFADYPRLRDTENAVCVFRNSDHIVWRPQAMSKTHSFRLSNDRKRAIRILAYERKDYVWDNIGVAFHVPHGQIFHFRKEILTDSLRLCEGAEPNISTENFVKCEFGSIRP